MPAGHFVPATVATKAREALASAVGYLEATESTETAAGHAQVVCTDARVALIALREVTKPPAVAELVVPLDLAIGMRAALASQISWLESLHPTRSRVERLNMLRPLWEQLRTVMEER